MIVLPSRRRAAPKYQSSSGDISANRLVISSFKDSLLIRNLLSNESLAILIQRVANAFVAEVRMVDDSPSLTKANGASSAVSTAVDSVILLIALAFFNFKLRNFWAYLSICNFASAR